MTDERSLDPNWQSRRLVGYFGDCLAAQTQWDRAINVVDQKDVTLFPLTASQQQTLGRQGSLSLADANAIDLAKRVALSGSSIPPSLGALFLVGRIRSDEGARSKPVCSPLLEIPISVATRSDTEVEIRPEQQEFSINFGLLSELLHEDDDDLQDRLADLSERVPDFPIDQKEFETFWKGFRLIAPEVHVTTELPSRRSDKNRSSRVENHDADGSLTMVDFYTPKIPDQDLFCLLPATAILFGQKAQRSMSALNELRTMAELPLSTTAFASVFDPSKTVDWKWQPPERLCPEEVLPLPLTPAQLGIVESSRSAPLTVVTGPPGTGKSYTIASIVLDAILSNQTVLIASQMDKAIEVVAEMVEKVAGPLAIARSGGRAAQRDLAKKITRLTGPRNKLDNISSSAIEDCVRQHYDLTRQVQQLEDHFRQVHDAERRWSELHQRGQRTGPLLPVSPESLRIENASKAEALFRRAERNGTADVHWLRRMWSRFDHSRTRRLLGLPSDIDLGDDQLDAIVRHAVGCQEMESIRQTFQHPLPTDLVCDELDAAERRRRQVAIDLVRQTRTRQIQALLSDRANRESLRELATLLRRRNRIVKQQIKERLPGELLLRAFPAWACTSRALCEILPAEPGMFDVVVLDEASQCDPALASVALMRGKRAVIVGDANQLRHVCFLSKAREQASFVRNDISSSMRTKFGYRRSVFDVASDTVDHRHFFFLNEHFRSHPQIIEFSNRSFYEGGLDVMTSRPSQTGRSAIGVERVGGQREPDSSINRAEVDAVVGLVRRLVEESDPSIGIVSPFRDHADAIRERCLSEFTAETIAKHDIVVGTAHALQGDEKDVVILTTSIDTDSHPASLRFLETPNLFNVAITRARHQLIVVTSVTRDALPPGLLRQFLSHAETRWMPQQTQQDAADAIEEQILGHLKAAQIAAQNGFRTAGTRIDVVAMGDATSIAILCDRFRDADSAEPTALTDQRRLGRAGWRVVRLPHRSVDQDWPACLDAVRDELARRE